MILRPRTLLRLGTALACLSFATLSLDAQIRTSAQLYSGVEFAMSPIAEPSIPAHTVRLTDFGAVPDGVTLCTDAFHAAFAALSEQGGGRLIVPAGTWLTGPIVLQSNIEIHTEAGALVRFSTDKSLYPLVETEFEGYPTFRCQSPISGHNLKNIAFTGKGVFDGSGEVWRPVKRDKLTERQWKELVGSGGVVRPDGKVWYPSEQYLKAEQGAEMNVPAHLRTAKDHESIKDFLRPVMVNLVRCQGVLLDGPTFQNSPAWCIHPLFCEDVIIRNLNVRNPWFSQNGDGLDIDSCKNVVVYDSTFDVGDDAICIKSGKNKPGRDRNFPTENVVVKNCVVYHGHGGVTVGSEMSSGVRNLHVSNCTFIGTDVGLRFKSNRGRGGVVEQVFISDIRMTNIPAQAISFDLYYGGMSPIAALKAGKFSQSSEAQPVTEETPQFRDIHMRNITINGAFIGVLLQGLPEMPLENVVIENLQLQAENGIICKDAKGITLRNVSLTAEKTPMIEIADTQNLLIDGLHTPAEQAPVLRAGGARSSGLQIRNSSLPTSAVVLDPTLPKGALTH